MLDAFAIRVIDGYAAAAPTLARALELSLATDIADGDASWWLSLSSGIHSNILALEMWDDEAFFLLAARQVGAARDSGALVHLQFALSFLARSHMHAGELTAAALVLDEAAVIAEVTGNPALVNAPMILAAWRGDEERASELIEASSQEAARRGWTSNNYAKAVLYNGLGRHEAARDAAWEAFQPDPIGYGTVLVPELAEAASRTGDREVLEHALRMALGTNRRHLFEVGQRNRSAPARTAERREDGRRFLPRLDRAPLRHPRAGRARADPPSLRRVAAARTSPGRRSKAVAHRVRGIQRHGRRGPRGQSRT